MLWLAHSVDWSTFPIRVRNPDRASKSIHRMNHKITLMNALVSNLLERLRESFSTAILTKRHDTVAEACDYII